MESVLIVEDDADIRETLGVLLADEGYAVTLASNGLEALDHIQRAAPDLILLDLMMPVMNGWELLERLRGDPAWSQIPVLVLSAASTAMPPGATVMMQKPVDAEHLLAAVRAHAH